MFAGGNQNPFKLFQADAQFSNVCVCVFQEELMELFAECGEVKDVFIHPSTDRPFGYG